MCGQRSSVATMPARRVGEQDVEVAARDPPHRARRQRRRGRARARTAAPAVPGAWSARRERAMRADRSSRAIVRRGHDDGPGAGPPGPSWSERRAVDGSARRSAPVVGRRAAPTARPPGPGSLVRRAERDLLDRDRGEQRDDRADHAEPEGLGDREAEGPVDALDDGRDERLELRPGRPAARRSAPRSPTPVSWPRSNAAALAWRNPSTTCGGTPAADHLRHEVVL